MVCDCGKSVSHNQSIWRPQRTGGLQWLQVKLRNSLLSELIHSHFQWHFIAPLSHALLGINNKCRINFIAKLIRHVILIDFQPMFASLWSLKHNLFSRPEFPSFLAFLDYKRAGGCILTYEWLICIFISYRSVQIKNCIAVSQLADSTRLLISSIMTLDKSFQSNRSRSLFTSQPKYHMVFIRTYIMQSKAQGTCSFLKNFDVSVVLSPYTSNQVKNSIAFSISWITTLIHLLFQNTRQFCLSAYCMDKVSLPKYDPEQLCFRNNNFLKEVVVGDGIKICQKMSLLRKLRKRLVFEH